MGEDGRGNGGKRDFVIFEPMPAIADPKNAVGMMPAAAHVVDHVEEVAKGPAGPVASPQDRPIHDCRVRNPTSGE